MNLHLELGLASVYFVTDPDRGVGVLQHPRLLLARRTLQLEDFARFIARPHPTSSPEDASIPDVVQMLAEVNADQNLSKPIPIKHPLFVIAAEIEGELLSALKRLKLRGLADLLAVSDKTRVAELEEPFTQLFQTFRDSLVYAEADHSWLTFEPLQELWVVAGLRQTVLSTTLDREAILRSYPGLKSDVSNVREPL